MYAVDIVHLNSYYRKSTDTCRGFLRNEVMHQQQEICTMNYFTGLSQTTRRWTASTIVSIEHNSRIALILWISCSYVPSGKCHDVCWLLSQSFSIDGKRQIFSPAQFLVPGSSSQSGLSLNKLVIFRYLCLRHRPN